MQYDSLKKYIDKIDINHDKDSSIIRHDIYDQDQSKDIHDKIYNNLQDQESKQYVKEIYTMRTLIHDLKQKTQYQHEQLSVNKKQNRDNYNEHVDHLNDLIDIYNKIINQITEDYENKVMSLKEINTIKDNETRALNEYILFILDRIE